MMIILKIILDSVWVLKFDRFLSFFEKGERKWCQKAFKGGPEETILWVEWIAENSCVAEVKQSILRFWRSLETI